MGIDSRGFFDMKCQHGAWVWGCQGFCDVGADCHQKVHVQYLQKTIRNTPHYSPFWNFSNAIVLVLSLIGLQWQGGGFTKWLGRGSNTETGEAADFDGWNSRDPGRIPNRKGTGIRVLDGFRGGAWYTWSCLFQSLRRKDIQRYFWNVCVIYIYIHIIYIYIYIYI